MTPLQFSTNINAPKEKVWNVLWNDGTYRQWTAVFAEGSHAESDWEEGDGIRFLSPNGDGMYGVIQKKKPFEEMVFEHHGEIKAGKEEPRDWAGAKESYRLTEKDGATELAVQMDITEEHKDYFSATFPKALQVVKQLAEQQ